MGIELNAQTHRQNQVHSGGAVGFQSDVREETQDLNDGDADHDRNDGDGGGVEEEEERDHSDESEAHQKRDHHVPLYVDELLVEGVKHTLWVDAESGVAVRGFARVLYR